MPLNAYGWTSEEDVKLAELVKPHSHLYNLLAFPTRKSILARESTWQEIAQALSKPVEECKKRWRGLRDGFMRSKRMGTLHKTKAPVFEKLGFLQGTSDGTSEVAEDTDTMDIQGDLNIVETEQDNQECQEVITDNQEYYEITVVDGPQETKPPVVAILPQPPQLQQKKVKRITGPRKKTLPMPQVNAPPIKILPKPMAMINGPKLVRYGTVEEVKNATEQRSEVLDKLIERVLKENTNEVDIFFRSMAASVKKLQPNLIPKVKMEVCNVIAKYEMQSFEKGGQLRLLLEK